MSKEKIIHSRTQTFGVYLCEEKIYHRVLDLASRISYDYARCEKPPVFICVLKGAVPFLVDLIKNISIDCELEFLQISSYEGGVESSGKIKLLKDIPAENIMGRDVIVVEDIVDTGLTMRYIVEELLVFKGVRSVKTATLLLKHDVLRRKEEEKGFRLNLNYVGFEIPNVFVIGYGLDYDEKYRNLKDIYSLEASSPTINSPSFSKCEKAEEEDSPLGWRGIL